MANYDCWMEDRKTLGVHVTGITEGQDVWVAIRYAEVYDTLVYDKQTAGGTEMWVYYSVLTPGRNYVVNVAVGNDDDGWIGSLTFSTPARPEDWTWDGIYKGAPISNLTGGDWNGFTARINEFRAYDGKAAYNFTQAKGVMTLVGKNEASRYFTLTRAASQAIEAISDISGHGALPWADDVKSAAFFNKLADALNAVD